MRAEDGSPSSQQAGREVYADAVRAVDPALAQRIERVTSWRKSYIGPVRDVVIAGTHSPEDAVSIARDGLASLRRHLVFGRDGEAVPLGDALEGSAESLASVEVGGAGPGETELEIPYRGEVLRGPSLLGRLDAWAADGVVEPSCAEAVGAVVRNPAWLDLSDLHVTLLGAASQMGPLEKLLRWRGNVIAVDLPRKHLWDHVATSVARGTGRVWAPIAAAASERDDLRHAGVDLLTQGPAVAAWLEGFDRTLTIGNYVYADGSSFARLAGVVDAIADRVLESSRSSSLAYLATPTDVFAVPREVVAAARDAGRGSGRMLRLVSGGRLYSPNYSSLVTNSSDGGEWGISDCLVPIQGPNYALAKSAQRWRAVVARTEGHVTSANVAPATRTQSVVKNKMLAAAYAGAGAFGIEIFEPETSKALMAALLVYDLRNPSAVAQPDAAVDHPYRLFTEGAAHGGIWRLPYEPRSILPLALARGMLGRRR